MIHPDTPTNFDLSPATKSKLNYLFVPFVTYQQHHNLAEKQILMTTVDVCVIMFTWLLMTAIEFQVAVYNTES